MINLALVFSLMLFASCAKTTLSLQKTGIEEDFINSFNKTTNVSYPVYASTKIVDKTFWIYVATKKNLLTINSASSMGGVIPEKIIKFVDIKCSYENSVFSLDYVFLKYSPEERIKEKDIFKKAVGGTSLYQDFTNETIEILQKTYSAIGDIISKTENLNFFAIAVADIENGIKITFVIHRLDMEQFLLNMLPSDEFYNRMILKTEGSKDIINDKYGLHIEYNDISLVDFLREQIANHARSKVNELEKYEPEKLESIERLDDIILASIYDVTSKYEFNDFTLVEVLNLITKEKQSLSKFYLQNKFEALTSL